MSTGLFLLNNSSQRSSRPSRRHCCHCFFLASFSFCVMLKSLLNSCWSSASMLSISNSAKSSEEATWEDFCFWDLVAASLAKTAFANSRSLVAFMAISWSRSSLLYEFGDWIENPSSANTASSRNTKSCEKVRSMQTTAGCQSGAFSEMQLSPFRTGSATAASYWSSFQTKCQLSLPWPSKWSRPSAWNFKGHESTAQSKFATRKKRAPLSSSSPAWSQFEDRNTIPGLKTKASAASSVKARTTSLKL